MFQFCFQLIHFCLSHFDPRGLTGPAEQYLNLIIYKSEIGIRMCHLLNFLEEFNLDEND